MKQFFNTKRLCRAAAIAALYVALTFSFMPFAFGPIQVRPAEALCILPLFFPEAVPALYIGCMLSNITSPFLLYDVFLGSLVSLLAAFITYMVGRFIKKDGARLFVGGLFPVLLNALLLPLMIIFLCDGAIDYPDLATAYFSFFVSLFITQSLWIYALGTPLYLGIKNLQNRHIKFFE